ncbi:MAG: hypothetical protein ABJB16_02690 [Saprospiraceae bacterium]
MKTYFTKATLKIRILHLALVTLIILTSFDVTGQENLIKVHDYLMPQKGKSMVEVYTGLPYVAIGQYSYGFSDRFSAGIIYGYTPFVKGFGFRIKSVIAEPDQSMRISLKSPFIYYPKSEGQNKEPWVLAWPAVNFEWKLKNEAKIWAGAGIMGAACTEYLFKSGSHMDEPEHIHTEKMEKDEKMFAIYNTFQVGYSKPFSQNLSYVIEVAPVMKGFKLKSPDGFLDALPVIVTTGLSYSF